MNVKYLCADCEHVFDEDDAERHVCREYNGGVCIDELVFDACPNCGSEHLREGAECAICGEWYADDKLIGDVCEECLKAATTPENIWKYSKQEGEMKKIVLTVPDVVADYFERGEIVAMIRKAFCELKDDARIAEYCMLDKESFADFCRDIAN